MADAGTHDLAASLIEEARENHDHALCDAFVSIALSTAWMGVPRPMLYHHQFAGAMITTDVLIASGMQHLSQLAESLGHMQEDSDDIILEEELYAQAEILFRKLVPVAAGFELCDDAREQLFEALHDWWRSRGQLEAGA